MLQVFFTDLKPGEKARAYKKLIGAEGLPRASNEYYRNIICYCDLDTPLEACRYSAKACVAEVNRQLKHRLTRAHREKQLKMSCQALHNAPPNRT